MKEAWSVLGQTRVVERRELVQPAWGGSQGGLPGGAAFERMEREDFDLRKRTGWPSR